MKQPPMQKQAERLAAQGRFGDTMLVHMNPAEVEGIASLMPGGQLTTNPQTGQPEAFIGTLLTIGSAIAGGIGARKQRKAAQKQTDAIMAQQQPMQDYSADTLRAIKGLSAFKPAPVLADMDPSQVSFLPKGASQGFNLDYQNVPGTMYANYQPDNPFAMGDLPRQVVQQPVMQEPVDTDEGGGTVDTGSEDVGGMAPDFDSLELINASRRQQGLPEFESVEDFYDFISDINEGGPGGGMPFMMANEGGLASLPVHMAQGGEGFANLGAHIASSMPAFSSARQLGLQMQGKMKGDLGQLDTSGGPGYNTVGTEEYESRQRPVKKFLARMRARQQARQAARAARRAEKPSEVQQESRPRITGLADRIQSFKNRQANKAEAVDAANAYARSMGVPEAQRGGIPGRIRAFDERMNQRIRNRAPVVGQMIDFFEGRGGGQGGNESRGDLGRILGGILSLRGYADGDMVEDFPRVNGPISGPGTETSDDIPAMLSDGEFVVNAKAVRGIGRLNGANKSKEEQRREGARMMYALQRAGEQAMRRS